MDRNIILTVSSGIAGFFAVIHALSHWSITPTVLLFAGGAVVAFIAEVVVINRGWLTHHITPAILGVPLYILFSWTIILYIVIVLALSIAAGFPAVVLAASIATGFNLLTDNLGVTFGLWSYTGGPAGPSLRSVPWWNFAGWFLISGFVAGGVVTVS